jgi:hypothetical protein
MTDNQSAIPTRSFVIGVGSAVTPCTPLFRRSNRIPNLLCLILFHQEASNGFASGRGHRSGAAKEADLVNRQ